MADRQFVTTRVWKDALHIPREESVLDKKSQVKMSVNISQIEKQNTKIAVAYNEAKQRK